MFAAKGAGIFMGVLGGYYTMTQMATGEISPGRGALDLGFGAIGFFGVPGMVISGAYFGAQFMNESTERLIQSRYGGDRNAWWRSVSNTTNSDPHLYVCFTSGTKIRLADGNLEVIENIRVGDSVLTYNLDLNQIEKNIVKQVDSFIQNIIVAIRFENGVVNTNTPSHPYFVRGKGWCSINPKQTEDKYPIKVNQLKVGDNCFYLTENGDLEFVKVVDIKSDQYPNGIMTYNLSEVENNHNFIANGFLVHNKFLKELKPPENKLSGEIIKKD